MNHRSQLQSAFVLHSRPWKETSLLLDVLTENHGKIALCAKGVRGKKSPKRSFLQPLSPLSICWVGRGDLQTLTSIESAGLAIKLTGNSLYSAFYINELMVRLLHRHDPHPELFQHYQKTIERLSEIESLEQTLREFEMFLLASIGYGLTLEHDIDGEPLFDSKTYLLSVDGLFQIVENTSVDNQARQFLGANLISIAARDWKHQDILKDAKRLLRLSLQPLLGDKPLQSRKLFRRNSS